MKNQLTFFVIIFLFLVVGCNKKELSEVKSEDLITKIIIVADNDGSGFAKLRISSTDQNLINSYTDKSFEITYEKQYPNVEEHTMIDSPMKPSSSIDIEIVKANLPELAKISFKNRNNAGAKVAARWVTVNLFAFSPKNYLMVYNKSSNNATVTFAYNKSSSGGNWVNASTRTINPRKDASYCNQTAKQIRATYTYDANTGGYDFYNWQYFKCP